MQGIATMRRARRDQNLEHDANETAMNKSDLEKAPEFSVQKDEITPALLNKRMEKGDTW